MTPYAVLSNLYAFGLPLANMGAVTVPQQQAVLDARNEYADDKMRARYKLPLSAPYPMSLILNICMLAAWDILMIRGYNPGAGADVNIAERGKLAMQWFDDVERQRAHPNVIEAAASPGYAAPAVISKPLQGWFPGTGQQ